MKVDNVFETPEGTVEFKGELTPQELETVVTVGLNYLFKIGAMLNREAQKGAIIN